MLIGKHIQNFLEFSKTLQFEKQKYIDLPYIAQIQLLQQHKTNQNVETKLVFFII